MNHASAPKVVIQGLWVGDRLPVMQQLSVASFLANGHDFHLYTYSELHDVPPGTIVKDAGEVIPQSEVFKNARQSTFAAFSDFFRYKLLLDRGGWWSDVDMVCLRPFDFAAPYVFSSEHDLSYESINSGVIKAPAGSEVMAYAWETCLRKDRAHLNWKEVGPDLLASAVRRYSLDRYVQPAIAFCALPMDLWHTVVEPSHLFEFQSNTYSVHLWHEFWRRAEWDVDEDYAPGCLYEQFRTLFLRKERIAETHNRFRLLEPA